MVKDWLLATTFKTFWVQIPSMYLFFLSDFRVLTNISCWVLLIQESLVGLGVRCSLLVLEALGSTPRGGNFLVKRLKEKKIH